MGLIDLGSDLCVEKIDGTSKHESKTTMEAEWKQQIETFFYTLDSRFDLRIFNPLPMDHRHWNSPFLGIWNQIFIS